MKLYTKTGDKGETSLYGGSRRAKDDIRVEAYGAVDELQAALGVVMAHISTENEVLSDLKHVQKDTFIVCCELARLEPIKLGDPILAAERIQWLEGRIDALDAKLPQLRTFIVQGGSIAGAHAHLARTICRRAERAVVALQKQEEVSPLLLQYLNRLSDYLFTAARSLNAEAGVPEAAISI